MKKILGNNKGFTLIELLAVIVVLSILMMIATTNVTSIVADTRKSGFARTAETIVSALSAYVVAQEMLGSTTKTCYAVSELVDAGYLTKVSNDQYKGTIKIDSTSKKYTLYLYDSVNGFYLDGFDTSAGSITGEKVEIASAGFAPTSDYTCP